MEVHGHVARRVGEVPADAGAGFACGVCDRRNVEELSRAIVDAGEEHEGDLVAPVADERTDIVGAQRVLAVARLGADQVLVRVQAVVGDLALHGVRIGRERGVLNDDLRARAGGSVEAGQHQVQVHREAVHHDDFFGQCADEACGAVAEDLVV